MYVARGCCIDRARSLRAPVAWQLAQWAQLVEWRAAGNNNTR